jgi:hypothetical protein
VSARLLRFSLGAYALLLRAYPAAYRRRYEREMQQVFRDVCKDTLRQSGARGLLGLWLPALWDWVNALSRAWLAKGRHGMNDPIERQLGDLAWAIVTGLRSAYSLPQVLEVLARLAPQPAAGECQRVVEALREGADLPAALAGWQQPAAPASLRRLARCLSSGPSESGSLLEDLDTFSADLLRECGSDTAFYPALRQEAEDLGAEVPAHVRQWLERSNPA